ncbi:hypothetical protein BV898_18365 [Hypsibius exemplaris]|uniref:G-protein coupled receptors family 1 profile domain-containing protein n=1 Tax=Hypsibius exemplaris TaxID=2072580 RepID=A0A9X6NJL5_HYPEX|nr:hypothetical protein BV898_18365 [Hypsibius exemplaris]
MNHSSNNTSTTTPFPAASSSKQKELSAWIGTTLGISMLGIINNLLILRVAWPSKFKKSGVSLLIFHFVAVNLFMCLVIVPVGVVIVLAKRDGRWLADNSCHFVHTLWTAVGTVVNWSDVGLAANRFIALYFPHGYKAWTSTRVNVGVILTSWAISVGLMMPFTTGAGGQGITLSELGLCFIKPSGRLGVFLSTNMGYVPYALSGAGSLLILWKCFGFGRLRSTAVVAQEGELPGTRRRITQRRLNMAKMLLIIFLWSGICSIPSWLITTVFPWLYASNPVSVMWIRTCAVCQYAFTPCILLLSNPEYQKRARVLFIDRPRGSSGVVGDNTSKGGRAPWVSAQAPNHPGFQLKHLITHE